LLGIVKRTKENFISPFFESWNICTMKMWLIKLGFSNWRKLVIGSKFIF
jgi:hypothetical protein